ncbi:MAG: penicillin acylase family protein, partial [Acidobacteria bacterium]|nr:penicillin acylase family protein [Acidobacteriota bacterium]
LLPALLAAGLGAQTVRVPGLEQPVEILRDRWGVPHIYARTAGDLFFAQGYIAAKDRLFQIDLWRRAGTGKLAEILGSQAIARDWLARSVRYRGNLDAEWRSYGADTKQIATAFTSGINAHIRSLKGVRPREFQIAGYDPGLWTPEDCLARVAGLLMTRNLASEVRRAEQVQRFGLATVQKLLPVDPPVPLEIPKGLNLEGITAEILRTYNQTIAAVRLGDGDGDAEQGSNNWVVDGTLSATGKPILANDPHRPVQIPSLRKTVHLVGPGWNVIGAGEPALPGIALGHNERVAFGFTIVGIDQGDLYVETLDPADHNRYRYRGSWKSMEVERESLKVKGLDQPHAIELRYTVHGPVIHEDLARHRAYVLRWVGAEPGGAGYLAALSLSRARNWKEFTQAVERYKTPSENLVYADTGGNIGWHASGLAPVRKNWSGLLPVPGESGEYEWSGFRAMSELPHVYNPASHFIATANHNILPQGYTIPLGYEFAQRFRFERIQEMLSPGHKFSVADFERLQHDVTSLPARRFQAILRKWKPEGRAKGIVERLLRWDARLATDSVEAMLFEIWTAALPPELFGRTLGTLTDIKLVLKTLEAQPNPKALEASLDTALRYLENRFGPNLEAWQWGKLHQIHFRHPLNVSEFNRGPMARPGDGNTVNATSGSNFLQTNGASYRQILDVADWDRSVMTNVPGESGDPSSPHYSDLLADWAAGKYHPMPYSRKAVEAATVEKILLTP